MVKMNLLPLFIETATKRGGILNIDISILLVILRFILLNCQFLVPRCKWGNRVRVLAVSVLYFCDIFSLEGLN